MKILTAKICKAGGRAENQDYCDFCMTDDFGIWVLADGLGGHRGGEVASRLAVETMLALGADYSFPLEERVAAAQAAILLEQKKPQLGSMRTTIVALHCHESKARWVHVGDTRLYHFRNGAVVFQTKDHSIPQTLVDAGEIRQEEIRHHPDQNRLLRALGNPERVKPTFTVNPLDLEAGDSFLLCTDGWWEYVLEGEMEADLSKTTTPEAWLQLMELRILNRAETGHDNYSAIAVFF